MIVCILFRMVHPIYIGPQTWICWFYPFDLMVGNIWIMWRVQMGSKRVICASRLFTNACDFATVYGRHICAL